MEVAKVKTEEGLTRYLLLDENGDIVVPVLKYLKFLDNTGYARNSLRAYCQHLKLFYLFMCEENLDLNNVGIDNMAKFVRWLQSPYQSLTVIPLNPTESRRCPNTINTITGTVLSFFDYLMRHELYSNQLSITLKKSMTGNRKNFWKFLYHVNKNKSYAVSILRLKSPKKPVQLLQREEITTLMESCSNLRDMFLINLLWESGIRIGEALSLWLEDFETDACKIHIRDRGELENEAEIKTNHSVRTIDVSREIINKFFEYVSQYFSEDVHTNHVFIKHSKSGEYKPLAYQDVAYLFRRLKKKTKIHASPHMLRHSSLTELHRAGWSASHLQKRAGHANVTTTIQLYVHPSDDDLRKDWDKMRK